MSSSSSSSSSSPVPTTSTCWKPSGGHVEDPSGLLLYGPVENKTMDDGTIASESGCVLVHQTLPFLWSNPLSVCKSPWWSGFALRMWTFEDEGCIIIQRITEGTRAVNHYGKKEDTLIVKSDLVAANGAHWSMTDETAIYKDILYGVRTIDRDIDRACVSAMSTIRWTLTTPKWKPEARVLAISFERLLSLRRTAYTTTSSDDSRQSKHSALRLLATLQQQTTKTWLRARQLRSAVCDHIKVASVADEILRYAGQGAATRTTDKDEDGSLFPGQVQLHDVGIYGTYDRHLRQQKQWMDCQEEAIAALGPQLPTMSYQEYRQSILAFATASMKKSEGNIDFANIYQPVNWRLLEIQRDEDAIGLQREAKAKTKTTKQLANGKRKRSTTKVPDKRIHAKKART